MAAFGLSRHVRRVGTSEDVEHRIAGIGQKADEELRQLGGKPHRMRYHAHGFAVNRVLSVGFRGVCPEILAVLSFSGVAS